jgi:hypothetical protein
MTTDRRWAPLWRDLERRIAAAGLRHRSEEILALARPAIQLRVGGAAKKAPGLSRAGGDPDLAAGDDEWPEDLSFVAQINLADVAALDVERRLPPYGLLSFYVQDSVDGDSDYLGYGYVHYADDLRDLRRFPTPKGKGYTRFPERALEFAPVLSLPPDEARQVRRLKLSREDVVRYNDELVMVYPHARHRLLGANDTPYHDAEAAGDAVLLSLGSDDRAGWSWGDGNGLSFYLDVDHLADRRFDEAWPTYVDAG